jgi:SAM-dependent methyltransferase
VGGDPLHAISALRATGAPAELAAAALTQASLRARAVGKFGADAATMFFTRAGLEQATRLIVAERRAARLAAAGIRTIADLGCGIGADARAFARAGLKVYAVEADPVTAEIATANTSGLPVTVSCTDATSLDLSPFDAVFCDPARRSGNRRMFDPRAYSPPWEFILGLTGRPAVIKLGPGIDHALLPAAAEAEWVSVGGEVVEAALWCDRLAEVPRRATLFPASPGAQPPSGINQGISSPTRRTNKNRHFDQQERSEQPQRVEQLTGDGTREASVGEVHGYIYDPDGAVIRAHLVAELADILGANIADPSIAYLYSDTLTQTPFARAFAIDEVLPFSLKRLRIALRDRGVGRLTIKKRGSALEPEQLRKQLRLNGPHEATVILTRVAGAPIALLCQPAEITYS